MRSRDTVQALIVKSLFRRKQQYCAASPRRFCSALPTNFYALLGVARTASKPVIKAAFREVSNFTQCQCIAFFHTCIWRSKS